MRAERLAAIGQTMAALSHETRNELLSFRFGLELLSRSVSEPAARDVLVVLGESRARLQRLFQDVQNFAGPIHLERTVQNLRDVWRSASSSLRPRLEERDAVLHKEQTDFDLPCSTDPLRIEQVFRNLIENSLAACSDPVWIEIRAAEVQRIGQSRGSHRKRGRGCLSRSSRRKRRERGEDVDLQAHRGGTWR